MHNYTLKSEPFISGQVYPVKNKKNPDQDLYIFSISFKCSLGLEKK